MQHLRALHRGLLIYTGAIGRTGQGTKTYLTFTVTFAEAKERSGFLAKVRVPGL